MTIAHKIEAYFDYLLTVRRVAPETERVYRLYLGRFIEFLGRGEGREIVTARKINLFLAWLSARRVSAGGKPITTWAQDKAYDVLRAFYRWGCDMGYFRVNPTRYLRPPIIKAPRRPIAARAEILRFLRMVEGSAASSPAPRFTGRLHPQRGGRRLQPNPAGYRDKYLALRDAALYATLYFCGARITETTLLQLGDVNLRSGFLTFRESKGGTWRDEPMHRELRIILRRWLRARAELLDRLDLRSDYVFVSLPGHGSPWTDRTAGHVDGSRMSKLLRERYLPAARGRGAGQLPARFTNHCFRHSFVTRLLDQGEPVDRVAELVGHKCIETTKIYAHYLPGRLRRSVEKA